MKQKQQKKNLEKSNRVKEKMLKETVDKLEEKLSVIKQNHKNIRVEIEEKIKEKNSKSKKISESVTDLEHEK
jgi:hypothetical protein